MPTLLNRAFATVGPVATAVLLAIASVVPVAWSLQLMPPAAVLANEGFVTPAIDWRPMGWAAAATLAACAVIPAALFGGYAGGLIWKLNRAGGALVALALAWVTGIIILPIAANVLDVPLRTGISCLMSCAANLTSDEPSSGALGYAQLVMGSLIALPAQVISAMFLVLGRRLRSLAFSFVGVVLAHALAHAWAIAQVWSGALVPYVSLVLGVAAWTYWLQLRDEAKKAHLFSGPTSGS